MNQLLVELDILHPEYQLNEIIPGSEQISSQNETSGIVLVRLATSMASNILSFNPPEIPELSSFNSSFRTINSRIVVTGTVSGSP